MERLQAFSTLRAHLTKARRAGRSIGFVPTMGALHEGHLSLVRRARSACDLVVASVFVNPLQFGPREDLARYPRNLEKDAQKLQSTGCDVLFTTTPQDMYPDGYQTYVVQEQLFRLLEGASRPGHFRGVLTVVLKLLNLVGPTHAYFGQKDFQQTCVIRRMVADLNVGVEIVTCPTVRDADGLALSSRNRYLDPEERRRARSLSAGLLAATARFAEGERSAAAIVEALRGPLHDAGVDVDYAVAVDPKTLRATDPLPEDAVALVAARLGSTRLIDNMELAEPAPRIGEA